MQTTPPSLTLPTPTPITTRAAHLAAPAVPASETTPLSTEQLLLQTNVPARDLRDLAVRLRPEVDEVPLVVNNVTPDYDVGDLLQFWVHDTRTQETKQITAELIHKTAVAYAWIESGQSYNREAIVSAVDRFSNQSYPATVAFFGSEWNPGVDNDPRLHILHTTGLGGGVAGYFSSADEYSRLVNPYSNEKEMFYISLQWLNATNAYAYYETVLAHEFQHMIHWRQDSNESTWINEGLSEYVKEVAGFGTDTALVSAFVNQPDTQLNAWPDSTLNHYGASYLLIKYLHQRFGASLISSLVAQPANGIAGLEAAFAKNGIDQAFDALFADWVVANYANQPEALGQTGLYGYSGFAFPKPVTEQIFDRYPVDPYQSTANNYATDYIRLAGEGSVVVQFGGQTTTQLADTDAYSGAYLWWSNQGDASDSTLTRQFDLSFVELGTPVTMEVAMWWNTEEHYDYGYVLASLDGAKWQILPGQRTTTENPSGNSFGPGYTGESSPVGAGRKRWVLETFDLSAYAGQAAWVRFEYITDDAISRIGWFVDDIRIPAIDYASDFETGPDGWESNGWLLTDNQLPQRWLLQVLEFEDETLIDLRRVTVNEAGKAAVELANLGNGRSAVLAISALAAVTTEPGAYQIEVSPTGD